MLKCKAVNYILTFGMLLLSGCAAMDFDRFVVPDMLTRAINPNVLYNGLDTGYLVSRGINTTDAHVYSMASDGTALARAMVARYNGDTNAAAMIQTILAATIAGIGMAGGPVGAAGGMGISSMVLGRIFTTINSPGQANAFLQFTERNTDLLSRYAIDLKAETCSSFISGQVKTDAGVVLEVGFNLSLGMLEKVRQGLVPTLEQLQGATVPAGARSMAKSRENCPPVKTSANRSTIP